MAEFPAMPPGSPRGTGFVYFLLARENLVRPLVKIGFSRRRPEGRMKDCQTGSPVRLEVAALMIGSMRLERQLHQQFAALHSHGEWFWLVGDLKSHIEGLIE